MWERIRALWGTLRFDPAKTSLGWWLAATHSAIVVLVVIGVSLSAIDILHDLADEQGKARVQLGGAMAREDLRRDVEDAVSSARVLADRAPLQRLLSQGRAEATTPVLRRYCESGGVDACAVYWGGQIVASAGPELPWTDLIAASTEQGDGFLVTPRASPVAILGGSAAVTDGRGARVFVARMLDAKLSRQLSQHIGLGVQLVNYRTFTEAPVDAFTSLHSAGLADGRSAVQRIAQLDLYASSFPVFASTGEAIALIEVRLPAADIDSSTGRLVKRLLITALILAGLAVLAGVILSRLVAGPVRALTDAAIRLREGDFSTSIPPGGAAEVGLLARTMEDMRRSLVDVTGALRRREAEARAVLGGVVEGVYAVDKHRTIRYLNPQAAELLGVKAEDAVGRFCGDVLKPRLEDGRRPCDYRCPIVQARLQNGAQAIEWLQVSEDGPRTTVITSSLMVDGLQVQVIRDETELEGVRRARDSVLANISHEFRTPLAAQLASIELLREGLNSMTAEQRMELVLSLERGTQRLTRLIDNLLESVRIESGQLNIRQQNVDLGEIIEDTQTLIGSLLVLQGQHLEVSLPEDLPPVHGDGQRLTQVFVNLVANASKFAPENSVIRIGATTEGAGKDLKVTAWVEDEGAGLPESDTGSIFERFRRGSVQEPEPGGLGLGLWIVKSIIDRHGGTIKAERTAENRTRFSITLTAELDT